MSITVKPIAANGKKEIQKLVAFHTSDKSSVFYQEILVPFLLMRMTVWAGRPKECFLSFYTPDAHFSARAGDYIEGRPVNSQHQHNCFEFTYVLEGNMYQLVEGKRYFYPAGSCCLMNRNTLHTEELSTDFTCIFVSVSVDLAFTLMHDLKKLMFPQEQRLYQNMVFMFIARNLQADMHDSKDFLDFIPKITTTEQIATVRHLFDEMLDTLILPQCGATYRLLGLILKLIDILCNGDYYTAAHVTANCNMDSLLFARIDRILSDHHGRISNRALAQVLNYNGSYLGRIVKKYTGKSLFDYSMTFAMAYAAHLLDSTTLSAAEIASTLHFSNRSHFYKLFQEYFGVTPRAYRDRIE